jgi:hypothetical protein
VTRPDVFQTERRPLRKGRDFPLESVYEFGSKRKSLLADSSQGQVIACLGAERDRRSLEDLPAIRRARLYLLIDRMRPIRRAGPSSGHRGCQYGSRACCFWISVCTGRLASPSLTYYRYANYDLVPEDVEAAHIAATLEILKRLSPSAEYPKGYYIERPSISSSNLIAHAYETAGSKVGYDSSVYGDDLPYYAADGTLLIPHTLDCELQTSEICFIRKGFT